MSRARVALSMVRLRVLVVAKAILLLQNIGISRILSRQNSNDDNDNRDERNKELNKRGCSADGRSEKPSALEHRLLFLLFVEYNPTSIYLSICLILFGALPPTKMAPQGVLYHNHCLKLTHDMMPCGAITTMSNLLKNFKLKL